MLRMIVMSLLTVLTMAGCSGPRYVDYFPYHDDGTPKPRIALLPVINSSQCGLPWNVAEEISQGLYYSLMSSGELYVSSPEELGPVWQQQNKIDFFGCDLGFAKEFCNTDFVVVLDLIEHATRRCDDEGALAKSSPECHPYNHVLNVRVRLRIIDVRRQQPRVALYEVVKCDYLITPPFDKVNYGMLCWGSKGYNTTPCCNAHQRMINSLAQRLEEVVQCAR